MVGSFLNVVIHRVPKRESIVSPRSRCPGCGTELRNRDNIPVLSWLVLRGRCRTCAAPISVRYPLVEMVTALLFGAVALRLGLDWSLPAFLVFTAGLVALSAIDLDTFLLPKRVVYPVLGAGAALLVVAAVASHDTGRLVDAVIGSAAAFGALFVIHFISPAGLGFGDVRLAALLGLFLGWLGLAQVFVGLFLGFAVASVVGLVLLATKVRSRKDRIPFGPFLAAGSMLAVWFGQPLVRLWLG